MIALGALVKGAVAVARLVDVFIKEARGFGVVGL